MTAVTGAPAGRAARRIPPGPPRDPGSPSSSVMSACIAAQSAGSMMIVIWLTLSWANTVA